MTSAALSEQLRLRIDASKYAEPGQILSVRVSGSAREALEFEQVVLRLMLGESAPGKHGPRRNETALLERVVVEGDLHLIKGQNVSYTVELEIPSDAPPSTGSAHHSLTYELRAEALSGFEQAIGTARRGLTVQCCRSRTGGLTPSGTEQANLVRTYKSDLLFGLIPVGSQVNCDLSVAMPTYGSLTGFMLGDEVSGRLTVSSKKTYPEAQIWWGAVARGGGKSDKFDLGGPVTVALDQNQSGSFHFNLPDRAPVSYTGSIVDYSWFMRVELVDVTGSNHKEEFAFTVLPRVQPRSTGNRRDSLTKPRASSTKPQGLSGGRVGGLKLGTVGGLTTANRGGLKLGSGGGLKLGAGKPQGLVLRPPTAHAAPEGLHQIPGGLHLDLDDLHVEPCEHPAETPLTETLEVTPIAAPAPIQSNAPPPAAVKPVQPPAKKPVQPPRNVQTAVAAQLTHEGPGLSPEVVQYLAKVVQSSPFFANILPDDLVAALSTPEALKGSLTPELRELLQEKLTQNPQIARVLPPHLVGAVAAAKTADQAQDVVGDALTGRLVAKLAEQPRLGVALKYLATNFPAFKKRLPSAVVDALPDGPGKIDLGAVATLIHEFPEIKKHIPAGMQAMLGKKK